MCLLVGPASSGKTAIIRNLSLMCGCNLIELPLTSGTDTSDLLGGFEQVEPQRKIQVRGLNTKKDVHVLSKLYQCMSDL